MNTFNTTQLNAIIMLLEGTEALAKRSLVFTKAIVIGRPDKPGCLLMSQAEEEDQDGKYPFLVSYFKDYDPKSVANGQCSLIESYTDKFYTWNDLVDFIVNMAKASFSEETYLSQLKVIKTGYTPWSI